MGHHDTGEFLLFQTNAQLLAKTATNTIARKNFQKFQLENAVFLNKKTNKKLAESTQKRMIREAFKELKKDEIQMFEGKMTVDWNKFVIGAVEKSKVVKKDKPKAVKSEVKKNKPKAAKQPKVEVKKETVTKSEPKIVKPEKVEKSKSEKVKNSESKISSPTSEEPVRVKGS